MSARSVKPILWAVGAVVTVVLIVGAAELVLRGMISNTVAQSVRTELNLPESHPVDVSLGGAATLHALQGGVGDITVEVPHVPVLDGIELDAVAHAEFFPFDPEHGQIEGATATLVAPAEQLDALITLATQGFASTGEVQDGDIVVSGSVNFFGQTLSASAKLGLSIEDGDLVIVPKEIDAAGFDLDVQELSGLAPGLAEPVVGSHTVCVRDRLPVGITLRHITLADDGAVRMNAAVDPRILSDPAQLELGTCE